MSIRSVTFVKSNGYGVLVKSDFGDIQDSVISDIPTFCIVQC